MSVHKSLESIKLLAKNAAGNHNMVYVVVIMNPNEAGEFEEQAGSTYEFVAESYFEKPRPNVKVLLRTDEY